MTTRIRGEGNPPHVYELYRGSTTLSLTHMFIDSDCDSFARGLMNSRFHSWPEPKVRDER
jgi:hypothetical protein